LALASAPLISLLPGILLAVIPLGLMQGWFLSHDVIPKVILTLGGAALLLFMLPAWMGGLKILWQRRFGKYFLFLALAQSVSLALSTAFSGQPALSFAGTVWRRFGLVEQIAILIIACAAASVITQRPDSIRPLLRGITAGGGVAALYGILQYAGFDPFLERRLYSIDYLGGIVRPPATMGHAIYFSAYLVPVTLVAMDGYMSEARSIWKYASGAVAILAPVAIILSGTRASLLALAAAAALFGWRKRTEAGMRPMAIGAGLVLAIAGLIVLSPAGATFRHRIEQWRQDLGGPRLGVWRDSGALIAQHPLFGTGPETFAVEFRKIESPALSRAYPDFYHETPHNAFIDAATGQGIPGAIILAALVVFMFAAAAPVRRTVPAGAALEAAFAGMIAGSFFASWTIVTGLMLWMLAGSMAALSSDGSMGRVADSRPLPEVWRIPAAVGAVLLLAVAASLATQDFFWSNLEDAVVDKDMHAAELSYASATTLAAGMPGYELWGSREFATLARSLGNSADAASAWRRAGEASALAEQRGEERFSAAYQSSVLAIASGDLPRGEAKARDAIALAPNWYKPHLLLAQILQAGGNAAESSREARVSADLGWRQGVAP
jgi:O-antigen ligase